MPKCTTQGVELNYLDSPGEAGTGPTMIFIHGAGGNGRRWLKQLNALTGCRGLALDLPGHGLSEGRPCDQVFLYREWVKEFMDAMEIEKALIAGHSMGGAVAMDLCAAHPSRVQGLLLVATGPYFKVHPSRLEAMSRGEYHPQWVRDGFSASAPEELIQAFATERAGDKPDAIYADFLACSRFQARGLEGIRVPTRILCGTQDINTPPKLSEKLAAQIPGARLLLAEEAAHQILFERPQVVNGEIAQLVTAI